MKSINEKLKSALALDKHNNGVLYTKRRNDYTNYEVAIISMKKKYYFIEYIRYITPYTDKIVIKNRSIYKTLKEAEKSLLKWK